MDTTQIKEGEGEEGLSEQVVAREIRLKIWNSIFGDLDQVRQEQNRAYHQAYNQAHKEQRRLYYRTYNQIRRTEIIEKLKAEGKITESHRMLRVVEL